MEQFLKYLDLGNQPFQLFTRVAAGYFAQRSQVALPMLPWKRTGLTLGNDLYTHFYCSFFLY